MSERFHLSIEVPDGLVERIAQRAAEIAVGCLRPTVDALPYLSVPEVAEVLRCRPQRVHDLLSQHRLTRIKEGRRTLVLRSELEAYLRGEPTGTQTRPPRRRAA